MELRHPFYGWAVVLVATLVTFCSGPGQSFVFSAFVDPILAAMRQFSGDYSLGLLVMAAVPIVCTVMLYFFDPRRVQQVREV